MPKTTDSDDGGEPDGHRRASAVCQPRPLIAPEPVGAEQVDAGAGVRRCPQEVKAQRDHSEQAIGMTGDEEAHRDPAPLVQPPLHPERDGVALADDAGHPRPQRPAVEEPHALDRNEGQARVGRLRILRAEEIRTQHHRVESDQHERAHHREAMLAKAPPHQLPVGGDRDSLLGRALVSHLRVGSADRARPATRPRGACPARSGRSRSTGWRRPGTCPG